MELAFAVDFIVSSRINTTYLITFRKPQGREREREISDKKLYRSDVSHTRWKLPFSLRRRFCKYPSAFYRPLKEEPFTGAEGNVKIKNVFAKSIRARSLFFFLKTEIASSYPGDNNSRAFSIRVHCTVIVYPSLWSAAITAASPRKNAPEEFGRTNNYFVPAATRHFHSISLARGFRNNSCVVIEIDVFGNRLLFGC